jgi:hypothetical protein
VHYLTAFRVTLALLILETLALTHIWLSRGPVLLSEPSHDRRLLAQVMMKREFPYLSVQAYLEVRESATGRLHQQYLLLVRDQFQDLVNEIRSLEWRDNVIALDVESVHYTGPKAYDVR